MHTPLNLWDSGKDPDDAGLNGDGSDDAKRRQNRSNFSALLICRDTMSKPGENSETTSLSLSSSFVYCFVLKEIYSLVLLQRDDDGNSRGYVSLSVLLLYFLCEREKNATDCFASCYVRFCRYQIPMFTVIVKGDLALFREWASTNGLRHVICSIRQQVPLTPNAEAGLLSPGISLGPSWVGFHSWRCIRNFLRSNRSPLSVRRRRSWVESANEFSSRRTSRLQRLSWGTIATGVVVVPA